MENRKTFNELYESELIHEIEKLEEDRKIYKKKTSRYYWGSFALILTVIFLLERYVFTSEGSSNYQIYFFLWVLNYTFYRVYLMKYKGKFMLQYKEKIIRRIIRSIDESLNFNPLGQFPKSQYLKSEIFKKGIYYYKGEDLVQGKIGQTPICFSEIITKKKGGSPKLKTTFKGIFFEADFNKNFKTKTFVMTDKLERSFGYIGKMLQSLNSDRPPLVKLEDPEFEKYFAVYGEDQVEARYILSTSLMQRLTEFAKSRKYPVALSFVDNSIFVAISEPSNLFEPSFKKSNKDLKMIKNYYEILELVIGIVDDLNLNNRIWAGSKMDTQNN